MRSLSILLSGVMLAAVANAAVPTLGALKCEYRNNPLGIDTPQPRLSWTIQSGDRGVIQKACQVLVASTPDILAKDEGDLWDSGKVVSDQSIQVPYAGKPLVSGQRCFWKVRVWTGRAEPSAWSAMAQWSMGLLLPSDWKAQWIGFDGGDQKAALEYEDIGAAQWMWHPEGLIGVSAPVGVCWFRAKLTLPEGKTVTSARAHFTADNNCVLFVNGNEAGDAPDYHRVEEEDIAASLHPGVNILAIKASNAGDGANPAGVLASIVVQLSDGQSMNILSGKDWKSINADVPDGQRPGLDDSAWKSAQPLGGIEMAPWTGVGASDKNRLAARMLRHEFEAKQPVQATAYICGLGLFELYLNGARIGDQVLAPGQTEFNKRVFYMTFDVTKNIQAGKNAVGVVLGNGRFYAPRFKQPTDTNTYGYPKLLFQMRLDYADGSSETVLSDTSWKLTDQGPIRENNEYDGEKYNANMEISGWNQAGFDDAAWNNAKSVKDPGGVLSAQMAEPIKVTDTLKPVGVKQPKPGMYIFDMGQNMVGWCRLTVQGPKDTTVKLRFAETIKDDGSLYLDNIRGAEVTDTYTLKGSGMETWTPSFTYHGFRYVEVTGFPGEPTLDALEGQEVHDAVATAGAFACSNPLLNQIYKNVVWGVSDNYRSFPTDCPQRDERQGWLGDRSAECKGESYLFDIAALYGKWVTDMGDAQRESGSVSDVCPSYWPLYNDNVTWPSTFIIAPDMLYTQYADTRTIERHYDGMKKWIAHMLTYMKDDLMPRDNYGDWCVPPEEKHLIHSKDENRKTPAELLGTTYFIYDLNLMAKYAGMLGKKLEQEEFRAIANRMTIAFNKKYWNEEKGYYANGSETSQVLPLYFGIAPKEVREKAFKRLADHIMVDGKGHLATGLVGGQWLMRTLTDNGRADIVYTIASQQDYPSWGYMISKDATTIWELWNGDTADPAMNSHNHVMLVGDLVIWLNECLAGIQSDPAKPGFKHIIMKPHPVGDLTSARATHNSPHGEIASDWEIKDGKFQWKVTVPANTTATVHVPIQDKSEVQESGKPAEKAEGVQAKGAESGYAVFEVGSGSYTFSTPRT